MKLLKHYKWELRYTVPIVCILMILKYKVFTLIPFWLALLPLYFSALCVVCFCIGVGAFFGFILLLTLIFELEV